MRIALDSNRYTDFASGVAEVVSIIERVNEIYVPVIVLGELRAGFSVGTRQEKNDKVLAQFLNTEGVSVLPVDDQTTSYYASVYSALRRKGKPIPTNDMWIAALCLQHNLILFDRDSDFDHVPKLARI